MAKPESIASAVRPAAKAGSLKVAAQVRREWELVVPHGTKPEAILDPAFYRHEWMKLQPRDVVVAFAEDGSWEQELRVMFVSRIGAQVSPRGPVVQHVNREVVTGEEFFVKYVSPTVRWCIVRKADNARIKEGFANEGAATIALAEMQKAA